MNVSALSSVYESTLISFSVLSPSHIFQLTDLLLIHKSRLVTLTLTRGECRGAAMRDVEFIF